MGLHERLASFDCLYLYGATPSTNDAICQVKKLGKTIVAIIDRDPDKQGALFCGFDVLAPDAFLSSRNPKAGIMIVSAYQLEIHAFLLENGVGEESIFPFIYELFLPTYGDHFLNSPILDRFGDQLPTKAEKQYFASWRQFKSSGLHKDIRPLMDSGAQYVKQGWIEKACKGGSVLDAGAYDGTSAKDLFSVGLFSKVIAFEPFEANYQLMKQNIASWGLQTRIEPKKLALGHANATIAADDPGDSRWATFDLDLSNDATEKKDQHRAEEIEIVTLDSLSLNNIALIKADIEGHEMAFLEGAIETITREKPLIALSAYHRKEDPEELFTFFEDRFDKVHFQVGHHPLAFFELEYYISFGQ